MFRNAGKVLAHNSIISVGGSKDLKPLQDLITVEKQLLISIQKLSLDLQRSSEALRTWGVGEGDDLGDTLAGSTTLLNHFASALSHYAGQEHEIRDLLKAIRTREENLDELKRRRRAVASRAESAEKKLSKMGPENKNLSVQTDLLNGLRGEIRTMDTEIMLEEAALGDFKRRTTKEFMGLKFGGLAECCEKAFILADMGKVLIQEIPLGTTEPGFARAPYDGTQKVQATIQDAARAIGEVVFSAQPLQNTGPRGNTQRENTADSADSSYYRGGGNHQSESESPVSWGPTKDSNDPPTLPIYNPSLEGHFIEPSDALSTTTQPWETSLPQSPPAFGHNQSPSDATLPAATRSVDDLGVNVGPSAAAGANSSGRFATFPVKTRGTQLRDEVPSRSPNFTPIPLDAHREDDFASSIAQALPSAQLEAPRSPAVPSKNNYPSDVEYGNGPRENEAPPYSPNAGSAFSQAPGSAFSQRDNGPYSPASSSFSPPQGPPPGAASPSMAKNLSEYLPPVQPYSPYTTTPGSPYAPTPGSPYTPTPGYSGPPPPPPIQNYGTGPPRLSYTPSNDHDAPASPRPNPPPSMDYGPPLGPPPSGGLANPWEDGNKRMSRSSLHSEEGLAYMTGTASEDAHAAPARDPSPGPPPPPPPVHASAPHAPPHSAMHHKLESESLGRTSSESDRHVRFGGVNDVNAELRERKSHEGLRPASSPPPPPVPALTATRSSPPEDEQRSQRVPPPVFDPEAEERALNQAAARDITREMDALSVNAPSSFERAPSPLLPPTPAFARRAVSPMPALNTDAPPANESSYAPSSPSSMASPRSAAPSSISIPPLASPTLSSANATPSAYRTPPEYPRGPGISASKPSSSLASPGGGGPPPTTRTISAAAFRRPARLASGDPNPRPDSMSGGPVADVSPLSFKKRPLPSSPYPQAQRQASYNVDSAQPTLAPSKTESPLQQTTSRPAEEVDDFDYISAYANSHPEEVQAQNRGYEDKKYSTDLDSGLR